MTPYTQLHLPIITDYQIQKSTLRSHKRSSSSCNQKKKLTSFFFSLPHTLNLSIVTQSQHTTSSPKQTTPRSPLHLKPHPAKRSLFVLIGPSIRISKTSLPCHAAKSTPFSHKRLIEKPAYKPHHQMTAPRSGGVLGGTDWLGMF